MIVKYNWTVNELNIQIYEVYYFVSSNLLLNPFHFKLAIPELNQEEKTQNCIRGPKGTTRLRLLDKASYCQGKITKCYCNTYVLSKCLSENINTYESRLTHLKNLMKNSNGRRIFNWSTDVSVAIYLEYWLNFVMPFGTPGQQGMKWGYQYRSAPGWVSDKSDRDE